MSNYELARLPLGQLYLDLDNLRHGNVESEKDAIHRLCQDHKVLKLARDISSLGLNPLEKLGVVRADTDAYIVVEGNRRICALKLLYDPELAPANISSAIAGFAKTWTPLELLDAVVFTERAEAKKWLERIHSGEADGVGRRPWPPYYQDIAKGGTLTSAVVDHAAAKQVLDIDKLHAYSTIKSFLSNKEVRSSLGIHGLSEKGELLLNLELESFEARLKQFMEDVIDENISSRVGRNSQTGFPAYAKTLQSVNPKAQPTDHYSVKEATTKNIAKRTSTPKLSKPISKPKIDNHIFQNSDIQNSLNALQNIKLSALYKSLTSLNAGKHTILATVGAWVFLECITKLVGRQEEQSFSSFIVKDRLKKHKMAKDAPNFADILNRRALQENIAKHSEASFEISHSKLIQDMQALEPLILKMIECKINNYDF